METFVGDTGYWSIPNAALDIDADVLITPMPTTGGITDHDDPRVAQRREVIERLNGGEVTVTTAAAEIGVSTTTARKLLGIIALVAQTRSWFDKKWLNGSPPKRERPSMPNAKPPSRRSWDHQSQPPVPAILEQRTRRNDE